MDENGSLQKGKEDNATMISNPINGNFLSLLNQKRRHIGYLSLARGMTAPIELNQIALFKPL